METNPYVKTVHPGPHSGVLYTEFLKLLHETLKPNRYFEIGTETGGSLEFVRCDAVCVDPEFKIRYDVLSKRAVTTLYQMTSDEFFAKGYLSQNFVEGLDIAFLDGMHRFEYLLRDIANTERHCHTRSIIFLHDCLPWNARMALRTHVNGPEEEGPSRFAWTGDVWKLIPILKEFRPDLMIRFFDCPPTGLIFITHVDPHSQVLRDSYHAIIEAYRDLSLEKFTPEQLWNAYPLLDSRALAENPHDLTAFLNIY